jgi:hypothetical protein
LFVVETGEQGAHHIRTVGTRLRSRALVLVVLRALGADQVIQPGGHLSLSLLAVSPVTVQAGSPISRSLTCTTVPQPGHRKFRPRDLWPTTLL